MPSNISSLGLVNLGCKDLSLKVRSHPSWQVLAAALGNRVSFWELLIENYFAVRETDDYWTVEVSEVLGCDDLFTHINKCDFRQQIWVHYYVGSFLALLNERELFACLDSLLSLVLFHNLLLHRCCNTISGINSVTQTVELNITLCCISCSEVWLLIKKYVVAP